jgi:hypothetical protein
MKNASSGFQRGWRHTLVILSIALLIVLGALLGLALPCDGNTVLIQAGTEGFISFRVPLASVDLKAQPSGHLVMQSSAQVTDTTAIPWQVTVFKYPLQGMDPQPLMLGIKGIGDHPSIHSEKPLTLKVQDGHQMASPYQQVRSSLDWDTSQFDVLYDLSSPWSEIEGAESLMLTLPTEASQIIEIPITAEILQEWQTVASCQALLCTN